MLRFLIPLAIAALIQGQTAWYKKFYKEVTFGLTALTLEQIVRVKPGTRKISWDVGSIVARFDLSKRAV
jgi:translation elongation factor EF-1beta